MTQEQIQELHAAVHKAVIVEGKAKRWRSRAQWLNQVQMFNFWLEIDSPKKTEKEALAEVLRQHGLRILPLPGVVYGEWRVAQ